MDSNMYLGWKEIECGWSCSNEFVYLDSLRGHGGADVQELIGAVALVPPVGPIQLVSVKARP